MRTVREIYTWMDQFAPFQLALAYDNVGLLAGDIQQKVQKVLVTLDITSDVVLEAEHFGAQLIISHHPVIFEPIKAITAYKLYQKIPYLLVQKGISAICSHTNLDLADHGVNEALAQVLGINDAEKIDDTKGSELSVVRMGHLDKPMSLDAFCNHIKDKLDCPAVRVNKADRPIKKVAVCGGSGGDALTVVAKMGADAYVTADVKHSKFLEAKELGMYLIDAGHFSTENVIVSVLTQKLKQAFRDTEFIISANENPVSFL